MLRNKLDLLSSDSVYVTLLARLEAETQNVLNGAGSDDEWYILFNQVRDREREVLGL
jgi:hypothetical protein